MSQWVCPILQGSLECLLVSLSCVWVAMMCASIHSASTIKHFPLYVPRTQKWGFWKAPQPQTQLKEFTGENSEQRWLLMGQ